MTSDPILSAFDRRLDRDSAAAMIVSRQGAASVEQIDALARALADRLSLGGVRPGLLVGLSAPNGPGFIAGLLAVRRLGATSMLLDWRTPEAEKTRALSALGAAIELNCQRPWPDDVADFRVNAVANPGSPAELASDVAVIKLTSGSTGLPRGIVTPSAALVADDAALAATMDLGDDERILAALPMSHSYALSSVVMPALMRDSVLVLPEEGHPLDPMIIARQCEVTFLPTVPAYLQALVKMSNPPRLPTSLRLVIAAGAPLKPTTATRFREVYGHPVHVFYGASECGGITFDRTGTAGERGSLGTPVDGVRMSLESLAGAASGAANGDQGTVVVRSPAVARGYLPAPDPVLADGRFRTSDLGVWRHDELFLEGRLGNVVNVRGKKVDPLEIDSVLRQLEAVEEAVTLGCDRRGRDETVLRSFIACQPGSLCQETVQHWCRRHLASHKVPRSIVLLERLPRTERGKLDRAALLAIGRLGSGKNGGGESASG